jgi:hypothetical protein
MLRCLVWLNNPDVSKEPGTLVFNGREVLLIKSQPLKLKTGGRFIRNVAKQRNNLEDQNCQHYNYRGADKSLARTGRKQFTATEGFEFHKYILLIIIIGGILVLFMYITRLVSKEIFSPSNKIHQEVCRAKD